MSVKTYRDPEPAWVDQVKILGGASGTEELEHVCIVLRMQVGKKKTIGFFYRNWLVQTDGKKKHKMIDTN